MVWSLFWCTFLLLWDGGDGAIDLILADVTNCEFMDMRLLIVVA